MPTDHRAELQKIRTFPSLVKYLRDEMNWPITTADFEELTFEYTPEELGIDAKNAAKIEEIKRLRPLSTRQPWGIFFIKFEPKRLPVVALRRILSQLALKKRASANSAERTAWAADDLLFVSNYGEGDERQMSLAHFSKAEAKHDLPTLKVLGWDSLDAPLHLDDVAERLTHDLAWPDDESDVEAWRTTWRSAFTLRHREVITTSRDLSIRLAQLARSIRDRIGAALAIETDTGPLTNLMKAFQEALVHDLDADGFADMYAQTIAYGLLSARVANPTGTTADDAPAQMPVTNPFLKELMEAFLHVGGRLGKAGGPGIDFDELGVCEVVELLDDANMEAVVRDFGDRNPQEDPVIHFYELFLKEYDAIERVQRGVFYTPRPVVSYIVRSVDDMLRRDFGLEDGLADTATWREMAERSEGLDIPPGVDPDQCFVQILDPATGTGTFLVETIDLIHRRMWETWRAQGHTAASIATLWNDYVPKYLLPRVHGYELLMAPYAMAHLKIGLKLHETGYQFASKERVRVYLTNALEPPTDFSMQLDFGIPALAHEARAVNAIKLSQRFTVVIGNPPYAKASANRFAAAEQLVSRYKDPVSGERNLQPLSDDYLKFMAFSDAQILRAGAGIHGMVTNRGYLVGVIHRGVRSSLLSDFNAIVICDLHGDSNVGETAPEGVRNENVFDIQQGVTIGVFARLVGLRKEVTVADVWGSRSEKYEQLLGANIECRAVEPEGPYWLFREAADSRPEYSGFASIESIFLLTNGGIKTHRDHLVIDFDRDSLIDKIDDFIHRDTEDEWSALKRLLRANDDWQSDVHQILYRPFDVRWIVYEPRLIDRARVDVMREMLCGHNLALVSVRQVPSFRFTHAFVSRTMIEMKTGSHDRGASLSPLWVHGFGDRRHNRSDVECGGHGMSNVSAEFLTLISDSFQRPASPEDALGLIYATLYSPGFRVRYTRELGMDFARIPLPRTADLYETLVDRGAELVALHLLESPLLTDPGVMYSGPERPEVSRIGWSDETVWLNVAGTKRAGTRPQSSACFRGVPEAVWNFHVGGYQVCEKWLKDRKGRSLSKEDLEHYQKIIVALAETTRLMEEIDEAIEQHGGWPGAFRATGD